MTVTGHLQFVRATMLIVVLINFMITPTRTVKSLAKLYENQIKTVRELPTLRSLDGNKHVSCSVVNCANTCMYDGDDHERTWSYCLRNIKVMKLIAWAMQI